MDQSKAEYGAVYRLQKVSGKSGLKINTTFWFISAENFREQRNIWKGSPVFPDEMFQTEIRVSLEPGKKW